MDERRALRVSETIKEELLETIGFEMHDPRLATVEVTGVHVTPDLRQAYVLIGINGSNSEQEAALRALEGARHYLRQELARRLNLRKMPDLHFELDPLRDTAERIAVLLRRAKKTRAKSENQP